MTRIIINGCLGRLGTAISNATQENLHFETVAGVDIITPVNALPFPMHTDIKSCNQSADVVLVCTPPHATEVMLNTIEYCVAHHLPLMLCTTDLPREVIEKVSEATKDIAVLISANLSLGVNVLMHVVGKVAQALYDANFDIEIIEKHHNQKLDAPSGTAYVLAETINTALGGKLHYNHDRSPQKTPRKRDEIGLHAIRGGTITGEHSVIFAGSNEVIEIKHSAQSRDVFATGALQAAQFIKNKPAGMYTMQDVINASN